MIMISKGDDPHGVSKDTHDDIGYSIHGDIDLLCIPIEVGVPGRPHQYCWVWLDDGSACDEYGATGSWKVLRSNMVLLAVGRF